jgi:hypothetical protein
MRHRTMGKRAIADPLVDGLYHQPWTPRLPCKYAPWLVVAVSDRLVDPFAKSNSLASLDLQVKPNAVDHHVAGIARVPAILDRPARHEAAADQFVG